MSLEQLYTIKELSDYFKVDIRTVASWIQNGYIRAGKFGGVIRIVDSEVKAFIIRSYRKNIKGWELETSNMQDERYWVLQKEGLLAKDIKLKKVK
jgi:excisionase family DNA binding protein